MTTRAREVLIDCEHALRDFAAAGNLDFQRPRWIATITLLRTVLDVLEKVDAPQANPEGRRQIQAARRKLFENKPEPQIFHEFIEDERNDAVHQYKIRAAVNIKISPPAGNLPWMFVDADPRAGNTPTAFDFFMKDGPFKNRDPRELCREAIEFWRHYLDEIDSLAAQHRAGH